MSDPEAPTTAPPEDTTSNPARTPRGRYVIVAVLGISLLGAGAAQLAFGSIAVAVRYLRGERLILTPSILRVDGLSRAKPVRLTVEVRNLGATPVRVIGAAVDCSCVTVGQMPRLIPAGDRCVIDLEVRALPGKTKIDQQVVFFTDLPARPRLGVHVNGPVRD